MSVRAKKTTKTTNQKIMYLGMLWSTLEVTRLWWHFDLENYFSI